MKKKDACDYSLGDFLMDDEFVRWVKQPEGPLQVYWQQVMDACPHKVPLMQEARSLLLQYRFEPAPVAPGTADKIWQQVQYNYKAHQAVQPGKLRRLQTRWWRYAAAVLLLVAAGTYGYRLLNNRPVLVATKAGEVRSITLPDGSVVLLNQLSQLQYNPGWNRRAARNVKLEGEAYFTVQQRESQPFTVQCSKGNIQVLGTSFNVKSGEKRLQVILEQGAVQLAGTGGAAVKMEPGDMVVVDGRGTRRKKVNTAWHTAWRNNRLVFTDAPLQDIFSFLHDEYGWHINSNITLTGKRFNGTAPAGDPDMLLEKLGTVYRLHIRRTQDSVWITTHKPFREKQGKAPGRLSR